jgi:hypothetical protein
MTWSNPDRWSFDAAEINARALAASGVYLIGNNEEDIYLGASDDMRKSLLGHFNGDIPCILERGPIWFSCSPVQAHSRESDLERYIADLHPTCT